MSRALVPRWFLRTVSYCGGLLVIGAVLWVIVWILLKVALVTITLLAALLLAALLDPLARLLRRVLPAWAAALLSVLFLVGVVGGTGYLVTERIIGQLGNVRASLTQSLDSIRDWLVNGPLSLAPQQVDQVRLQLISAVRSAVPNGFVVASTVSSVVGAVLLALLIVFFLLKDGREMWHWLVRSAPAAYRDRVDQAGRIAWNTTSNYVVGVLIVALADALGIGTGLLVIGVPLALSLTVLVFLGAFVPLLGATLSGGVAILVTLVTNGPVAALIMVGVVLVVQNVEGNLLQPLVQGRAVRLHPVVILISISAGYLLFGIAGAAVAVPIIAVSYRVGSYLRQPDPPSPVVT